MSLQHANKKRMNQRVPEHTFYKSLKIDRKDINS